MKEKNKLECMNEEQQTNWKILNAPFNILFFLSFSFWNHDLFSVINVISENIQK